MDKPYLLSEETMEELLHNHSPVLLLHKNEKFLPVSVECFFEIAEINKDNGKQEIDLDIKRQFINTKYTDKLIIKPTVLIDGFGKNEHKDAMLKQQKAWLENKNKLTVYGQWSQTTDEKFLYLTLTYYFFYLGNIIPFLSQYYSHDCDWEMVRIFLKLPTSSIESKVTDKKFLENGIPESILFQQHDHDPKSFDLTIKWSSMVEKGAIHDGTHPEIFVGNGTHASSPPFDTTEDDLDPELKKLIKQKSFWKKIKRRLARIGSDEYYNNKTKIPLRQITPKNFSKTDKSFSQRTHYQLTVLNGNKNSQFWLNFQGSWGTQWKNIKSYRMRGPKFFIGFERNFNYTKNPSLQKRESTFWRTLGQSYLENYEVDRAKACFFTALDLVARIKTRKPHNQILADINHNLGKLEKDLGNRRQAKLNHEASLASFQDLGDKAGEARSLHQLAILAQAEGRMQEAQKNLQAGLVIFQDLGDKAGEANNLGQLGILAQAEGRLQEAKKNLQASLAIFQSLGDKTGEANSLGQLGILA